MTDVYTREYRLRSTDVDMYRRLRLSTMFVMLQEASIAHTEQLGMGRDKTLDRGLLWVVTHYAARIARLPEYDEEITLSSWPGNTIHVLFPRFYRLTDAAGAPLVEVSALWALMDGHTRAFAFPEDHGIVIGGVVTGNEIPLPRPPRTPEPEAVREYTPPYSCVDLNGHMNNTRYFDLAEDLMPAELRARPLREIAAEFAGELRLGDPARLLLRRDGAEFHLAGENEKRLFRICLRYE